MIDDAISCHYYCLTDMTTIRGDAAAAGPAVIRFGGTCDAKPTKPFVYVII